METFIQALKDRDTTTLNKMITENPEILDTKISGEMNGFAMIAYSELPELLATSISLKSNFNFYEAIIAGNLDIVTLKVENNKDIVNSFSPDGFTPVALATYFQQHQIVIFLIEMGADPDAQSNNPSKVNALHASVARNNIALAKIALNAGANPNLPQMHGITPLHSAAHRGNLDMVKLLIDSGAEMNKTCDKGMTALDYAKEAGHHDLEGILKGN